MSSGHGDEADTASRIESFILRAVRRIAASEDPTVDMQGFPGLCSSAAKGNATSLGFAGARDLASMLKTMRTSYELVTANKTATSREVYYLSATYFEDQSQASDIGATIGYVRMCYLYA